MPLLATQSGVPGPCDRPQALTANGSVVGAPMAAWSETSLTTVKSSPATTWLSWASLSGTGAARALVASRLRTMDAAWAAIFMRSSFDVADASLKVGGARGSRLIPRRQRMVQMKRRERRPEAAARANGRPSRGF